MGKPTVRSPIDWYFGSCRHLSCAQRSGIRLSPVRDDSSERLFNEKIQRWWTFSAKHATEAIKGLKFEIRQTSIVTRDGQSFPNLKVGPVIRYNRQKKTDVRSGSQRITSSAWGREGTNGGQTKFKCTSGILGTFYKCSCYLNERAFRRRPYSVSGKLRRHKLSHC